MREEKSSVFICKNAVSPCVVRVSRNSSLVCGWFGCVLFLLICFLSLLKGVFLLVTVFLFSSVCFFPAIFNFI